MKEKSLYAILSLILLILSIIETSINIYQKSKFQVSIYSGFLIFLSIIFFIFYTLKRNKRLRYNLYKKWRFLFSNTKSCWSKMERIEYTYINRTELRYKRVFDIISNVDDLKHICNRFQWSKKQEIKQNNMEAVGTNVKIYLDKDIEFYQSNMLFDELGKGQKETVGFIVKDLYVSDKEAAPMLSNTVTRRTLNQKMTVIFQDKKLQVKNAEFRIYKSYADDSPFIIEKLAFDEEKRKLESLESKPICGYKYEIRWSFVE